MPYLCITVRWLDDRYHGLLNRDGPPEWPPSPYRLFQSMVAGSARRSRLDNATCDALRWFEQLPAPIIIAPPAREGRVVHRFVPNNDADARPERQARLTGKVFRPTIMLGPPEAHYVWVVHEQSPNVQIVVDAAGEISCLGWGIDSSFGHGRLVDATDIQKLPGIRWMPQPGATRDHQNLRIPKSGSLTDLLRAHESASGRIQAGRPLRSVDKAKVFETALYTSPERPIGRPYAAFILRDSKDDFFSYPHAKLIHIAGMVRNAAIKNMREIPPPHIDNPPAWLESFVAGHRSDQEIEHRQLSYLPLPSIGNEQADALIRRIMIVAPLGCEAELSHLCEQLDGEFLIPEYGGPRPILDRVRSDGVVRCYSASSKSWSTVTPVVLPGHDDHKPEKTAKLIERALNQSGLEQKCEYTWSPLPNFKNCLPAFKHDRQGQRTGYFRPDHLEGLTAVHMHLTFEHNVTGPIAVGAGRHCGLGLFAAVF